MVTSLIHLGSVVSFKAMTVPCVSGVARLAMSGSAIEEFR